MYTKLYTPATVLALAASSRTTKLFTYIDIWINGYSYINELGEIPVSPGLL